MLLNYWYKINIYKSNQYVTNSVATDDLDEYTKVIHVGSQYNGGKYFFMDGRMDIVSGDTGMYDWMATVTNNYFQGLKNWKSCNN